MLVCICIAISKNLTLILYVLASELTHKKFPSTLVRKLPKSASEAASPLLGVSKMDHQTSRRRLQSQYLTLYNFISAILWLAILGRVILLVPLVRFRNVYGGVGTFAKWTQTLALLEVFHSASGEDPYSSNLAFRAVPANRPPLAGIVRSPLLTTVMQVASRLLLLWGIVNNYPATTSSSPAYSSMLVAWSVTEVIRYSYFVLNMRGSVPGFVRWLRYSSGPVELRRGVSIGRI